MASEEKQRAVEKIRQENLFNSLAAGEAEAETDAFQCTRCKQVRQYLIFVWHFIKLVLIILQRKTRYRQAQTRSADEPMTVSSLFRPLNNLGINRRFPDFCHVRIL